MCGFTLKHVRDMKRTYSQVFFNFNEFIFVYVVNITLTYDGEIYLSIYSGNVIIWDPWILIYHPPVSFVPCPLRRAQIAQSGGKSKSVCLKSQQCSQNGFYYYLLVTFKSLQWLPANTWRWHNVKVWLIWSRNVRRLISKVDA